MLVAIGFALLPGLGAVAAQRPAITSSARRPPDRVVGQLACDSGWSTPRVLRTPAHQPIYVEAPLTVSTSAARYLIGSPTLVWADSTTFVTQNSARSVGMVGVRMLNDSTAIPLPPLPTATKPYMPIAVARGAKLLAVWGTSADTSGAGVFHQDTLWEAMLDAGRWSVPRPIRTSGEFAWRPGAASFIADDSSLVLAFPSTEARPTARRGVTIMLRSGARWRIRQLDVGGTGPQGVALMRSAATEVLVAVVGSVEREGIHVPNGVYAIRASMRDTSSVPRFTLIREIRQMPAEDPSVFRTPHGVHVVWRQSGRRIFAHDSLVEATSRDHGESWMVTSTVSLGGDTRGMRTMPLADESAEAMALDIGRLRILTLRRAMGSWALRPEAFLDAKTIPMISAPSDRLTVSFGQTRSSSGPDASYDAPVLVTTTRALRCEPPSAMRSQKRLRAPPRGKSTLR